MGDLAAAHFSASFKKMVNLSWKPFETKAFDWYILGLFLWQPGTYEPVQNSYSWTNLTNMVYIDQPVSTGFSPGNITVNDEHDVTTQFMGFCKY